MLTRTMFWVFLEQGTILQISEKKNIFIVQLLEQSFQSPQNDAMSVHTASIDILHGLAMLFYLEKIKI